MDSILALTEVTFGQLLLLVIIAFFAGILGGVSGFGGGLVLPPFLVPMLGAKAVVPVISVAMLLANSHRLWLYRYHIKFKILAILLASALPMAWLGTLFYANLNAQSVSVILGFLIVFSVPLRRLAQYHQINVGPLGLTIGSGLFGLGSGTTTGLGMLLAPIMLGAGLVGPAFLATDAALSTALNLLKIISFGQQSILSSTQFKLGLLLGVAALPGNLIGRSLLRRTSSQKHKVVIELLIIIGGLTLLIPPR